MGFQQSVARLSPEIPVPGKRIYLQRLLCGAACAAEVQQVAGSDGGFLLGWHRLQVGQASSIIASPIHRADTICLGITPGKYGVLYVYTDVCAIQVMNSALAIILIANTG